MLLETLHTSTWWAAGNTLECGEECKGWIKRVGGFSMCVYFATDIDRINNEYMPLLDLEIGRYINYSKLESMLSTQTLFFCNASRFDDEYEGEIPLEFFDGWAQQSEENYRRLNELKS